MNVIDRRSLLIASSGAFVASALFSERAAATALGVGIASPPSPHVFPLLLALAEQPTLPVRLLPIAESRDADSLFASGEADALLAMTYVGAKKRMSGAIPDLQLVQITTWRGFFAMAAPAITNFKQLRGKTVVVSGPVGSGKGGGGDVIFQAVARRQGVDPTKELNVVYEPVAQGIQRVLDGRAAAITLPGPASTGMIMRSRFSQSPIGTIFDGLLGDDMESARVRPDDRVVRAIDFQAVFSGFRSFPSGQLPLGGLHATQRALDNERKRTALELIGSAYVRAASKLMSSPTQYAGVVSAEFEKRFASTGAQAPPPRVIAGAIAAGDLVYRGDIAAKQIETDLMSWLAELVGRGIERSFLADAK